MFVLASNIYRYIPRKVGASAFGSMPRCTSALAAAGLFYEAAADLIYPIDEVVASCLLTLVFSASSAVYSLLGAKISPAAMNWLLTGGRWGACNVSNGS